MNNDIEIVVTRMMRAFNQNYTGFRIDDEGVKNKLWVTLLSDYDAETIKQATLQIIATRKNEYNWAPDPATVREQCLNLVSGILTTPTGVESWGHVLTKLAEPAGSDDRLQLTETESTALEQVAGKNAIYDLRHGTSASVSFARRDFIAAFDSLVNKQRLEIMTSLSVRQLVEKNAPLLPAPESKQLPPTEDGSAVMSMDEARAEFGTEFGTLDKMLKGAE